AYGGGRAVRHRTRSSDRARPRSTAFRSLRGRDARGARGRSHSYGHAVLRLHTVCASVCGRDRRSRSTTSAARASAPSALAVNLWPFGPSDRLRRIFIDGPARADPDAEGSRVAAQRSDRPRRRAGGEATTSYLPPSRWTAVRRGPRPDGGERDQPDLAGSQGGGAEVPDS